MNYVHMNVNNRGGTCHILYNYTWKSPLAHFTGKTSKTKNNGNSSFERFVLNFIRSLEYKKDYKVVPTDKLRRRPVVHCGSNRTQKASTRFHASSCLVQASTKSDRLHPAQD